MVKFMNPRPPTEKQLERLKYLLELGVKRPATSAEATKLLKEAVTKEQAAFLRENDRPIPLTKAEASEAISKFKDRPTPTQLAKLKYFGYEPAATKQEASETLDGMEFDLCYDENQRMWELEKYDLYPELYEETGDHLIERLEKIREIKNAKGCLIPLVLVGGSIGFIACKIFS